MSLKVGVLVRGLEALCVTFEMSLRLCMCVH